MRETAGGRNMKKIWKQRSEEGVSPVIATILMVAITVVLAAVLYVMVIQMGNKPPTPPPAGSLQFDVQSSTGVTITFGAFSPIPKPMDVKIMITNNSDATDIVDLTFSGAPDASTVDMLATNGAAATYTDMNYNGNTINAGDFISVCNLGPHTSYTVKIYDYTKDSLCTLVGDDTFILA
jgi:flagellin-like protein